MTFAIPGLPKRNPGLQLANAFSVSLLGFSTHHSSLTLITQYSVLITQYSVLSTQYFVLITQPISHHSFSIRTIDLVRDLA